MSISTGSAGPVIKQVRAGLDGVLHWKKDEVRHKLYGIARSPVLARFFIEALLPGGGLDKATLSLCAAKLCKLVLAEAVREEVEQNLFLHAKKLSSLGFRF